MLRSRLLHFLYIKYTYKRNQTPKFTDIILVDCNFIRNHSIYINSIVENIIKFQYTYKNLIFLNIFSASKKHSGDIFKCLGNFWALQTLFLRINTTNFGDNLWKQAHHAAQWILCYLCCKAHKAALIHTFAEASHPVSDPVSLDLNRSFQNQALLVQDKGYQFLSNLNKIHCKGMQESWLFFSLRYHYE